uniref:Uncharacterized protein n=1 Tax=Clytia hemisphaerica TaxID=252671 RepID=A0A7M5WLF9_9CNID
MRDLGPQVIDPKNCTPKLSLHQQILNTPKARLLKEQRKQWFNLGNNQTSNDPITAAEYLLKREYGESAIFKHDSRDPVFIPSEIACCDYDEKSIAVLDYNIDERMKLTLDNLKQESPEYWLTKELDAFLQTQALNNEIKQDEFNKWMVNLMTLYLMKRELPNVDFQLPSTTCENFVKESRKKVSEISPNSELEETLQYGNIKKNVKKEIKNSPPEDVTLKWLFNVELSQRGDKIERTFFEELLSLRKDSVLEDTIILPSVHFMTNIKNKMHQEFDILIFSWSRKLIIGVEIKKNLTAHTNAFEQLENYHFIMESQLGDLFGEGWKFFPVVCSENQDYPVTTQHYITLDTDVKTWLESVFKNYPVLNYQAPVIHPLEQLKKVLQIIVFTIHVSRKDLPPPITPSCWIGHVSKVIDSLSNTENIVFYSNKQLPVLTNNEPKYNKLVIKGGYSTGKTFLLQEKAIMLSNNPEYKDGILYVVCNGEGLLYRDRKLVLEPHGVRVIKTYDEDFDLKNEIEQNNIKAVFLDEWNVNQPSLVEVENTTICWIAPNALYQEKMNRDDYKFENTFKGFQLLQLSVNLRNSKEIIREAKSLAEERLYRYTEGISEPPSNFPNGPPPVFVKTVKEAVEIIRKSDQASQERNLIKPLKSVNEAVKIIRNSDQASQGNSSENKVKNRGILVITDTITDVDLGEVSDDIMFYDDSFIQQEQFEEVQNPCEFLRQGNSILITKPSYVNGFEWNTVIYKLSTKIDKYIEFHDCNITMRCTTNLFIVNTKKANMIYEHEQMLKALPLEEGFIKRHTIQCVIDYLHFFYGNRLAGLENRSPYITDFLKKISNENTKVSFDEKEILGIASELFQLKLNEWLLPIISETFKNIPEAKIPMTKQGQFDSINKLFVSLILDIIKKSDKTINWLVLPYTIHMLEERILSGALLPDFDTLRSNVKNFKRQDFVDFVEKNSSEDNCRENFWKTAAENLREFALQFKMLEFAPSDDTTLKTFKIYAIQFVYLYIKFLNDKEWLVPTLRETLENISKKKSDHITKQDLFNFIKEFFVMLILDIIKKSDKTINSLILPYTIHMLEEQIMSGTSLPDFDTLRSNVENFKRQDFVDFVQKMSSEDNCLENFWKTAAENLREFAPQFKMLEFAPSDDTTLKTFKIYAIQFVYLHIKFLNDKEWLVPALRETLENISKKKSDHITKQDLFNSIKELFVMLILDILKKSDKTINWFVLPYTIHMLEEKIMSGALLPDFDTLRSYVENFKSQDFVDFVEKNSSEDNCLEKFWKTDAEILREFAPQFKMLEFVPSDNTTLKTFKIYAIQFVCDYTKKRQDEQWLLKLEPVLKRTFANISKIDIELVSKDELSDLMKDFLTFLVDEVSKTLDIPSTETVWLIPLIVFDIKKDFIKTSEIANLFPEFSTLKSAVANINFDSFFEMMETFSKERKKLLWEQLTLSKSTLLKHRFNKFNDDKVRMLEIGNTDQLFLKKIIFSVLGQTFIENERLHLSDRLFWMDILNVIRDTDTENMSKKKLFILIENVIVHYVAESLYLINSGYAPPYPSTSDIINVIKNDFVNGKNQGNLFPSLERIKSISSKLRGNYLCRGRFVNSPVKAKGFKSNISDS